MSLVYEENPVRTNSDISFLSKLDPTKMALKHFDNSLYLTFMLQNGDRIERHQASKELVIAQKKIDYWKRNREFDNEMFTEKCRELSKKWST